MKVRIRKTHNDAKLPTYGTAGAAGADLYALTSVNVPAGERALIPTGISIELPATHEAQIRSRSGLAYKNGVHVLNSPGTIDSDYRGDIGVILHNTSDRDFFVVCGDRIAQMVIAPVQQVTFVEVDDLSDSERGEGGFGSTGVK